ncbi:MAG: ATP-binding protein [Chloroflexi bacterium]|nr:MAG: ATP-binding protein [Chloroflexota bacterium]
MTIGGTGTTALFAGPSGTGKTMAAGIIASELGLPLFRIDLARVVSKWIGETEKNLDRVFKAAEDSNAVLFLDEADSLLGKRSEVKDSHDRYANLEISYLLQKMELYDGLAILATNMRQLIDEAFMRRLSFTVLFPLPEEPDRRLIWDALWPAALPRQGDVDLDRLAHFRLPGGNIRNVVLAAAYLAATEGTAVGMRHLLHGVRREYQKLGKQLSDAELGEVPGPIELRVAVRR